VVELARMLAGMESTETGRAHAEELLETANTYKLTQEKFGRKSKSAKKKS
jgi:DNA repair protein RecN (Recombination protein N)